MNLGLRIDRGAALNAVQFANVNRDRKLRSEPYTLYDFLRFEEEPPITLEQAMEQWQ